MLISTLCFGASVVACCSFADWIGRKLGVIDHPDGTRKRHARPTPLIGGIALMVPLAVVAARGAISWPTMADVFTALAAAGLGFMLLGLFDDRNHATPAVRLLVSTALCSLLLVLAPELRLARLDFELLIIPLSILALPFTVLCLVGLQNAINMADGLNGLVIGLAIFWTTCLLLYASGPISLYLSLLLLGLFILLPYNLMGYLFLGDAGSYSLGVSAGLAMIYVYHDAAGALPMLTVMLWLLFPVLDCLRVMGSRILANRSPLVADCNHLHHRLARCYPWPVSVLIYLGTAALPGFVAALWPQQTGPMLLVAVSGYAGLLWLTRTRSVLAMERQDLTVL